MAHKGRPYPVAFRRDFNLNVPTYNTGWPNRYKITLGNLGGGPGGGLSFKTFDCGPATVTLPGRQFWTSDPELFLGFVFAVQLQAVIVGNIQFSKEILILEAVSGVILHLIARPDQFDNISGFPVGLIFDPVFADPFFFPTVKPGIGCNIFNKLWTDGPPH